MEADEQGRATYLISSNILNTGFYNSCGFVGVADVVLGDNNPTWHKKPVIVKIVRAIFARYPIMFVY